MCNAKWYLKISNVYLFLVVSLSGCINWHSAPIQDPFCPLPPSQSGVCGRGGGPPCVSRRHPRLWPHDPRRGPAPGSTPGLQATRCLAHLQARYLTTIYWPWPLTLTLSLTLNPNFNLNPNPDLNPDPNPYPNLTLSVTITLTLILTLTLTLTLYSSPRETKTYYIYKNICSIEPFWHTGWHFGKCSLYAWIFSSQNTSSMQHFLSVIFFALL